MDTRERLSGLPSRFWGLGKPKTDSFDKLTLRDIKGMQRALTVVQVESGGALTDEAITIESVMVPIRNAIEQRIKTQNKIRKGKITSAVAGAIIAAGLSLGAVRTFDDRPTRASNPSENQSGQVVDDQNQILEEQNTSTQITCRNEIPASEIAGTEGYEEFVEKETLAQMKVGESGWTVPWAMALFKTDQGTIACLNGDYTYDYDTGGTVQMLVKRTEDGYEVEVPRGYEYQVDDSMPWYGAERKDLIAVQDVNDGDTTWPSY